MKYLLPLLFLLTYSCAPQPGPAERIGRHLDEISKDFDELAKEREAEKPKKDDSWKTKPYDEY